MTDVDALDFMVIIKGSLTLEFHTNDEISGIFSQREVLNNSHLSNGNGANFSNTQANVQLDQQDYIYPQSKNAYAGLKRVLVSDGFE